MSVPNRNLNKFLQEQRMHSKKAHGPYFDNLATQDLPVTLTQSNDESRRKHFNFLILTTQSIRRLTLILHLSVNAETVTLQFEKNSITTT